MSAAPDRAMRLGMLCIAIACLLVVNALSASPQTARKNATVSGPSGFAPDSITVNSGYASNACNDVSSCGLNIAVAAGSTLIVGAICDFNICNFELGAAVHGYSPVNIDAIGQAAFIFGFNNLTGGTVHLYVNATASSPPNGPYAGYYTFDAVDLEGVYDGGGNFWSGRDIEWSQGSSTQNCSLYASFANEMLLDFTGENGNIESSITTAGTTALSPIVSTIGTSDQTLSQDDAYVLESSIGTYTLATTFATTPAYATEALCVGLLPPIPSPPTSLSPGTVTNTTIPLSWKNPTGTLSNDSLLEANYTNGGCGTYWTSYTSSSPVTSYTVAGLPPASGYCFEVEATNSNGTSWPSQALVDIETLPLAPTGLSLGTVTETFVQLNWTGSASASSYSVLQANYSGSCGGYTTYPVGDVSSYVVTGLSPGQPYCFELEAVDSSGASAPSSVLSDVITVPASPTSLARGATTTTSIQLTWVNSTGASSYMVLVAPDPGSCGEYKTTASGVSEPYTSTGLLPATAYCLEVKAVDASGVSPASVTLSDIFTIPSAPLGLVATTVSSVAIGLRWTAPSGVILNYTLAFGTVAGTYSQFVNITSGSVTSYLLENLTAGTAYYFTLWGWTPSGAGAHASVATNTTASISRGPGYSTFLTDPILLTVVFAAVAAAIVAGAALLIRRSRKRR